MSARGSPRETFWAALRLGLTSFGGPVAHLGYFERAFVRERRWLGAEEFGQLLALCQVVPGPASSKLIFLVGLRHAGYRGALAAWLGFTLPSAVLLFCAALLASVVHGRVADALVHGLKIVAVAVVAQAVWSMARRLWTDGATWGLGVLAGGITLVSGASGAQVVALLAGAGGGMLLCRRAAAPPASLPSMVSTRLAWVAAGLFATLLVALPLLAGRDRHGVLALASTFYTAGALVFGGGHVILPLLRGALVPGGWVSDGEFLAGYGLAQAVPGPLFTVAAYLGAVNAYVTPPLWAALVALASIFLPGMLVALAAVALWARLAAHATVRGALAGINAAVVGILAAALYDPVWTSSVRSVADAVIAAAGLALLARGKVPPAVVVIGCVAGSLLESVVVH